MHRDLRRNPRARMCWPITIHVNGSPVQGTVLNLTMWGCGAESAHQFQLGDHHLSVRIQLPDDPTPLEVRTSVIRWVQGHRFGLYFHHMRAAERERLRQLVAALLAGSPQ